MPVEINGLPAHVIFVHVVVVLVPVAALMVLASALWPAARRRLGVATPLVAFLALVSVPLATQAGEWLRDRVPNTPLVRHHAELGDQLLPFAFGMFVLALAVWWLDHQHRPILRKWVVPGRWLTPLRITAGGLAVVLSLASAVQVYRIGDSGAKAAWQGRFSQQATGHHGDG